MWVQFLPLPTLSKVYIMKFFNDIQVAKMLLDHMNLAAVINVNDTKQYNDLTIDEDLQKSSEYNKFINNYLSGSFIFFYSLAEYTKFITDVSEVTNHGKLTPFGVTFSVVLADDKFEINA